MDKKIILVKSNIPDYHDPWLQRHLAYLPGQGLNITFLGWDRERHDNDSTDSGKGNGYRQILLKKKAPWGITGVFYLPVWWFFVIFRLLRGKWDVVHAFNLDALFPVVIASKIKKMSVIYEIYDVYFEVLRLPRLIREAGVYLERLLLSQADVVILAHEAQIEQLKGISPKNVTIIYNTPPDAFRAVDKPANSKFTLFFAALLNRNRPVNLDKVARAIQDMDDTRLVIAGYGDAVESVKILAREAPDKVEFIGQISYDEVLTRTMQSDLLFALYDPIIPGFRVANGNKLYEAMMCQKPIIVSKYMAAAKLVREENCGLAVQPDDIDEIRAAIIKLKENPELCRTLGENGRKAYTQKYSRDIMNRRLLAVYSKICGGTARSVA